MVSMVLICECTDRVTIMAIMAPRALNDWAKLSRKMPVFSLPMQ